MKLTVGDLRSYPLEIYAGDELIWSGETEKSLGYNPPECKTCIDK